MRSAREYYEAEHQRMVSAEQAHRAAIEQANAYAQAPEYALHRFAGAVLFLVALWLFAYLAAYLKGA